MGSNAAGVRTCTRCGAYTKPSRRGMCRKCYAEWWSQDAKSETPLCNCRVCSKPIFQRGRKKCQTCSRKDYDKRHPGRAKSLWRDWSNKNPGRAATYYRRREYGVTPPVYRAMIDAQGYKCAICQRGSDEVKFHIDHCHTSGRARGVLCQGCNVGLGGFRDNPEALAAIEYLRRTYSPKKEEIEVWATQP